jgi:hypothetical protein
MTLISNAVAISRRSFLKFQNALQVRGSAQGNVEEDIIRKECYIEESDKTINLYI